jgi:hypothetical protein
MMFYNIEYLRHPRASNAVEIVDVQDMLASNLGEVVQRAALSLRTLSFPATPDAFRIRENGAIVYPPSDFVPLPRAVGRISEAQSADF